MPIYPLFGLGQEGKSPTVTAQRHLNCYAEFVPNGDKTKVAFYGTPGLTLKTSFGDTPVRGWIAIGSLYYAVHRGKLYSVNSAGTKVVLGTLNTTTGRVGIAYDGAVILIVDGTNGYTYTFATTTFAQIVDPQFPNGANTCDWLNGQFIVDAGSNSDSFYTSPDGPSWDGLDFATAESSPDGLVRVFVDHGQLLLAGGTTIEPWGSIGQSDFAFAAVKGSIAEFGLAARWSMCKYNDTVAFLAKNTMGQVQVMMMEGNTPRVISSQELDSIINNYATVSDATAYSYLLGGHPFYQISFPTPAKTWLYDGSTGLWSPLEYGLDGDRHRGEMHLDFINKPLISDYATGDIYELDPDVFTDNGVAIATEIIGKHVFKDYDRMIVDELIVDFETGIGLTSGQGSDPEVMLSISKDNGHSWGSEMWVDLGKIGKYLSRARWSRLGIGRDWLFKIRITDPIKRVITGANIRATPVGS